MESFEQLDLCEPGWKEAVKAYGSRKYPEAILSKVELVGELSSMDVILNCSNLLNIVCHDCPTEGVAGQQVSFYITATIGFSKTELKRLTISASVGDEYMYMRSLEDHRSNKECKVNIKKVKNSNKMIVRFTPEASSKFCVKFSARANYGGYSISTDHHSYAYKEQKSPMITIKPFEGYVQEAPKFPYSFRGLLNSMKPQC